MRSNNHFNELVSLMKVEEEKLNEENSANEKIESERLKKLDLIMASECSSEVQEIN